jgi:acyl transferase domain-containing protein
VKTAVVVCPGRGTYNRTELGWLKRHFANQSLLAAFDARRHAAGRPTLSELDSAESYSISMHTRGDNASGLIYAATISDFAAIANDVRVVAVTGNSMGWYSTLTCGGAVSSLDGFEIVETMGTLMQERLIGGQTIYPFVDEDWRPHPSHKAQLLALVRDIESRPDHSLALSIDLGGMLVLAGNDAGLAAFEASVPPVQGRFPLRLVNHAAFHTALQEPVAAEGRERLRTDLFRQPDLPMVDGRGHIWWPGATDVFALRDYTLRRQVVESYDFSRAIAVAAREFAPDLFIVTGPGTTLGGAVAQSLILADWRGLSDKAAFQATQATDPILVSMGIPEQRCLVTRGTAHPKQGERPEG